MRVNIYPENLIHSTFKGEIDLSDDVNKLKLNRHSPTYDCYMKIIICIFRKFNLSRFYA
jgi:hypothetical protein